MSIVRCLECDRHMDTDKVDVKAQWIMDTTSKDSFVSGYNWLCKPSYEEL